MEKRKKISLMLAVILIMQIIMPLLSAVFENDFTIFSIAETNTWDVSANGDGSVIATLDENGTMTISGTGKMKDYDYFNRPYYNQINNIETVNILEGIISISEYAFDDCIRLRNIVISDSVTIIGKSAFNGCQMLTRISIPEGVTNIQDYTFYYCCNLRNIDIYEGLETIGTNAFYNSGLTNIIIPSSVTSIKEDAFYYCNDLTRIQVSENNSYYKDIEGVLFDKEVTQLIMYPSKREGTSYVIPESITGINKFAFHRCGNLTSITIPEGVKNIGTYAFESDSLTSITIPESVTVIGTDAFYGCNNLTEIQVSENNNYYKDIEGVLFNKEATQLIKYPPKKEETNFIIPEGITSIERNAFYNCSSLININIPEGVTTIGRGAFAGCNNLTSIVIPRGVTQIENSTFASCSNLANIKLQAGLTNIGEGAFYRCSSLTNIDIPNTVMNIEKNAFSNCSSLNTIICSKNTYAETYAKEKNIGYKYLGDVNDDGEIDFKDIMGINSHRLGKKVLDGISLKLGDVQHDEQVDIKDIMQINLYRLGKITSL